MELKDLAGERTTFLEFDDGSKTSVTDNWMTSDDPKAKQPRHFKGKTVFKLASQRTGRKLVGKQSTLKPPEPIEPKPKRVRNPKLQVRVVPQPSQPTSKPVDPNWSSIKTLSEKGCFKLWQQMDPMMDLSRSFQNHLKILIHRPVRHSLMILGSNCQQCGLDFIVFRVRLCLLPVSNSKVVLCCLN